MMSPLDLISAPDEEGIAATTAEPTTAEPTTVEPTDPDIFDREYFGRSTSQFIR